MKRQRQQRISVVNIVLALTALALAAGIVYQFIRRFTITGAQWPIFAAGILALVVLAVLAVVFGPRYRGR